LSASIARGPYLGGVPRSLRRIFARALSVDPENRFPSMQALLKALESAQRRRTGWMVAAGAGLAVVAIAAVAIAMALRAEPAPAPAPELVVTSAEPAPADGVLDLAMGETRRLWIPGLTQVAVAEPDFADVRVAGANVLELKGIRAGETAMFVTSGKEARRWKLRVGAGPQANPPPQRLALGVGHSAILERKHLARVAVGDPEIADIKVIGIGGNQLLIVGQRLGSTTLLIWLVDGSREQIEIEVEAN
jgi:Flp pilus assembly secretin CpaC